jgi:hypothetical protein
MPRLSRSIIGLPAALAALFVVSHSAQAGVGSPVREDAEVGLRLRLTPDWRPIPSVRYEWQFKRGPMSLGVSFDYGGPDSQAEGLAAANEYAQRRLPSLLMNRRAVGSGTRTVTVGGQPALLVSYKEARLKPREQGQFVFLPRPRGMAIFTLTTTVKEFATGSVLFRQALEQSEVFEPKGLDASKLTLASRGQLRLPRGIPMPEHWIAHRDGEEQSFTGRLGACTILVDDASGFLASDAELVVRAAVERTRGQSTTVEASGSLTVDGWPAYFSRFHYSEGKAQTAAAIVTVVENGRLVRLDFSSPLRQADFMTTLMQRILTGWRFEKPGPAVAGAGTLRWMRHEQQDMDLAYDVPADWREEKAGNVGQVLQSGIGSLVIGRESHRPEAGPSTPEALVDVVLESLGKSAGGRAKVVAKEYRQVEGFPRGNLVVFTLGVPDAGIVKGWLYLAPRENDTLVICLMGHEAFFPALRPVMLRMLEGLRPLPKSAS